MTCVELFAGIGGFGLAAERAGFRVIRACELDAFARSVYRERFPAVGVWPDAQTFAPCYGTFKPTVLTAGFPCQDLSVAGKRAGLEGARSGLFWEIVRVADRLDPDWLLLENVPGLISSSGGRDLATVVGALVGADLDVPDGGWAGSGVACGPAGVACWRILDAQWFGVPQRRRRWFCLVDRRARGARACEVLLEPARVCGDTAPGSAPGQDVAAPLGGSAQSGGYRTTDLDHGAIIAGCVSSKWAKGAGGPAGDEAYNLVVPLLEPGRRTGREGYEDRDGIGIGEPGDPMFTLESRGAHGLVAFQHPVADPITTVEGRQSCHAGNNPRTHNVVVQKPGVHSINLVDATEPGAVAATVRDGGRAQGAGDSYDNTPTVVFEARIGPTLHEGQTPVVFKPSHYTRGKDSGPGEIVPPLSADADKGDQEAIVFAAVPRRLTPRECERLQGFPDDWTLVAGASDSARYRALGNAVAVVVAEWILRRLAAVA